MIALAEHVSEFGTVTITESKATRVRSYRQGGAFQSEADANGISTASYIHALFGLIRQTRVRKVLMIGCGGGTLATMLARAAYRVAIVDVNPASFVFARRYFGLPSTVECHIADGSDFLATTTSLYGAIVLDAYDGERIPDRFMSSTFFAHARTATRDGGCLLANVHLRNDFDMSADRLAARLAPLWSSARILDELGAVNRNAIVVAGAVRNLTAPRIEFPPLVDADVVRKELASMRFRAARR